MEALVEDEAQLDGDVVEEEQYLTFFMAGKEYGINILSVKEIREWQSVTHLPKAPSYVLGVQNLRGSVVPVVDLRQRFNLQVDTSEDSRVTMMVTLEDDNRQRIFGAVIDRVSGVRSFDDTAIQQPSDFDQKQQGYVKGIVAIDDSMISVIDPGKIL